MILSSSCKASLFSHNHSLLAVKVLLCLLLQLNLLLLHNLAELVLCALFGNLVLRLLLGALRGAAGQRLVEEVLVLALAPSVGAGALGDVGFSGVHAGLV
jgi:hypothetical protein